MNPYIGVTGFSRPEDVDAALQVFPHDGKRKLMVGVLTTFKSLRDISMKPKWAKQTPKPLNISNLFVDDRRVVNLVHFSTEEGQEGSVLADMLKIHELAGPNLHGFQLNLTWPETRLLDDYRRAMGYEYRVVLQIGAKAVKVIRGTAQRIVDMLYNYVGVVDDILLDPSGGHGKPFDTERAREFLSAIVGQRWNLGLGVAGGLGPDSLNLVEPLVSEFPDLNIDAQGKLRNAENNLDLDAVNTYLTKALRLLV